MSATTHIKIMVIKKWKNNMKINMKINIIVMAISILIKMVRNKATSMNINTIITMTTAIPITNTIIQMRILNPSA